MNSLDRTLSRVLALLGLFVIVVPDIAACSFDANKLRALPQRDLGTSPDDAPNGRDSVAKDPDASADDAVEGDTQKPDDADNSVADAQEASGIFDDDGGNPMHVDAPPASCDDGLTGGCDAQNDGLTGTDSEGATGGTDGTGGTSGTWDTSSLGNDGILLADAPPTDGQIDVIAAGGWNGTGTGGAAGQPAGGSAGTAGGSVGGNAGVGGSGGTAGINGTGGTAGTSGTTLGPNVALGATWWGDGIALNRTGSYPRIFASGTQSTSVNTPASLCDGSTSTFWVSVGDSTNPATFPQWVGVEFASAVTVRAVILKGRMNGNRAYNPSQYVIQTSDNGTTWTNQLTVAVPVSYPLTENPVTSPITTWLNTPVTAKWVRIYISAAFYTIAGQQQPTVPNAQFSELEIH